MTSLSVAPSNLADSFASARANGRSLDPSGSVASAIVLDRLTVRDAARSSEVAAVVRGESTATWAFLPDPSVISAVRDGDEWVLTGQTPVVVGGATADALLIAVGEGLFLVPLARATRVPVDALDPTRSLAKIRFEAVRVADSARVGGGAEADRLTLVALNLSLGETIGAMEALFEQGLQHAKSRVAFGRPIGSFQAVKHALVDASLALESSIAVSEASLAALVGGDPDAAELTSIARSFVSRSAVDLAHVVWQVLGGIAYTWANPFHTYLRRLTSDATLFGDASWHNERIYRLHGFGGGER